MEEKNNIEVSVVMPCLNEEESVGICVRQAKEALDKINIAGEIIVVDNGSTDNSVTVAQKQGAKVVFEKEKGYGSAYLKGFNEAKGEIIIMGDSDNSYDFSQIGEFILPLKEGYDLVIGSRFKGKIKKGAMPWANRYIGNPILSAILRFFFKTNISDAHCGIRALTKKAYKKMELHSLGMEFASEMVIAAIREDLKIKEIPVDYSPRKGDSKLVPVRDAWRHFSFMLIYSPTWLYLIPGFILFILGLFFMLSLLYGDISLFGHQWDVHIMVLASLFSILGIQIIMLGLFARTFGVNKGFLKEDKTLKFLWKYFKLEKGIFMGIILFLFGLIFNMLILGEWTVKHFGTLERVREAILGATFIIIGIQAIFSSFFLHMLGMKTK
ncbi:MAG: glycosyltransferase family 2 protein [Candidatus Omnitrophica bacterium]|nr:glycosyltransferase family 2 protein [Candidatus Omnitrophota bacterium]